MIFLVFTRRVAFSFYLAWFVFVLRFVFAAAATCATSNGTGQLQTRCIKINLHSHTRTVRIETTTWHMSQAAPGSSGSAPATALSHSFSLSFFRTLPLPMDSVVSKALEIYVQFNSFMTLPSSCNVRLYRNMYIYCIYVYNAHVSLVYFVILAACLSPAACSKHKIIPK